MRIREAEVSFEDFVHARAGALLRTALLLAGQNRADAEDLLQLALERAYRHWPRICRSGEPERYVRGILANASADRWRWLARRPEGSMPASFSGLAVADHAAAVADRDYLLRALAGLPPGQCAVLVLRYFDDLSEVQTAQLLGCSVGTVKSQAAAGGPPAVLTHLSCTSASRCMATGASSNGDLAETWNGTRWRLLASPVQLTGTSLHALSCTSAGACIVVGAHLLIGGLPQLTLAESWNGAKWTLEPPVNPRGRLASNLFAVSCAAARACMAAGIASNDAVGLQVTLAESWNGKRWSVSPTPRRLSATNESLFNAMSCVSAADCTAVGYFRDTITGAAHFLIEHWNGRRWNLPPASDISGSLTGVSCTSPTACTAVGGGIAETWNGTTWSAQTLPAGAIAVSCSSADACTAVGGLTALRWDGTNWTVQTVPSPAGGSNFALSSVSCPSATSCTSVGNGHIGGAGFWSMLAVAWDGTDWTIQPTPQASSARSLFPRAVSCTTAAACTAVGKVRRLGVQHTVAMHWNGTAWTIQPTPLMRNAAVPILNGVSCRSATACTAVGWWNNKQGQALTERRT